MLKERIVLRNITKRVINSDFLYFQTAPIGIRREVLVWWDRDCSRKMPDAPPIRLLVVGAGNSLDPGPARLGQEAKRGAQWLLQLIGEEIVYRSRHHRCSCERLPV